MQTSVMQSMRNLGGAGFALHVVMFQLAPLAAATPNGSCVRCPSCLHHRGCATLVREVHADCEMSNGILCQRSVYRCADLGVFFTHPTVPANLVARLYANPKVHTATSPLKRVPRVLAQYQYIQEHFPQLPDRAVIVEVGCSTGWLLRAFDGPGRTLVCFEPDASTALQANASLTVGTRSRVHVLRETFSREALEAALGAAAKINLFLSSHVLEHLPDMCKFMSTLHTKVAPGGAVFTELPNDTEERIVSTTHDSQFHLSMTTPAGWLRLMEQVGFVLGDLRTVRDFEKTGINGVWSRSLLFKKDPTDPSVVHGLQQDKSKTLLAALTPQHADRCRQLADSLGLSVSACSIDGSAGHAAAVLSPKHAPLEQHGSNTFGAASYVRKLGSAQTHRVPFEHLLLHNFFPAGYLKQVLAHYPSDVDIEEPCTSKLFCPAGKRSNIRSAGASAGGWPWPTWREQQGSERWRFWTGFYQTINSTKVKRSWMSAFSSTLRLRFGDMLPGPEELEFGVDFLQDTDGFELPPHTDVCEKLLSALLYLPLDGTASDEHGTAMYEATQHAPLSAVPCGETNKVWTGYREVSRAPYRRNTLFAFTPCRSSWHGVPKSVVARRSIFLWLRFADPRRHGKSELGSCTGDAGRTPRELQEAPPPPPPTRLTTKASTAVVGPAARLTPPARPHTGKDGWVTGCFIETRENAALVDKCIAAVCSLMHTTAPPPDRVTILADAIGAELLQPLMKPLGVRVLEVPPINVPAITRRDDKEISSPSANSRIDLRLFSAKKFYAWTLTGYRKVLWFDGPDVTFVRNASSLLRLSEPFSAVRVARGRCGTEPYINAGVILLRPSQDAFRELMATYYRGNFSHCGGTSAWTDQEVLRTFALNLAPSGSRNRLGRFHEWDICNNFRGWHSKTGMSNLSNQQHCDPRELYLIHHDGEFRWRDSNTLETFRELKRQQAAALRAGQCRHGTREAQRLDALTAELLRAPNVLAG